MYTYILIDLIIDEVNLTNASFNSSKLKLKNRK